MDGLWSHDSDCGCRDSDRGEGVVTISEFTPPGIKVVAIRSGKVCPEIVAGRLYTVRGMVINRHWKTREPDAHVLFEEATRPLGKRGEVGYPRDAFEIPSLPAVARELMAEAE
jgi:hypothetical protein